MSKIGGHTRYLGYCYKLCPYSTEYKTKYTDLGYVGNSTNGNVPFSAAQITDHPTTSGTMNMQHRPGLGWGWHCRDDNCYFFTTNGRRYFEA